MILELVPGDPVDDAVSAVGCMWWLVHSEFRMCCQPGTHRSGDFVLCATHAAQWKRRRLCEDGNYLKKARRRDDTYDAS